MPTAQSHKANSSIVVPPSQVSQVDKVSYHRAVTVRIQRPESDWSPPFILHMVILQKNCMREKETLPSERKNN